MSKPEPHPMELGDTTLERLLRYRERFARCKANSAPTATLRDATTHPDSPDRDGQLAAALEVMQWVELIDPSHIDGWWEFLWPPMEPSR